MEFLKALLAVRGMRDLDILKSILRLGINQEGERKPGYREYLGREARQIRGDVGRRKLLGPRIVGICPSNRPKLRKIERC